MKPKFIEFTEHGTNNKITVPISRLLYVAKDIASNIAIIAVDCIQDGRRINVQDKYEDIIKAIENAYI